MLQGIIGKDHYGKVKQDANIIVDAPENGHSNKGSSKPKEEEIKQNEMQQPANGNNSNDVVATLQCDSSLRVLHFESRISHFDATPG